MSLLALSSHTPSTTEIAARKKELADVPAAFFLLCGCFSLNGRTERRRACAYGTSGTVCVCVWLYYVCLTVMFYTSTGPSGSECAALLVCVLHRFVLLCCPMIEWSGLC